MEEKMRKMQEDGRQKIKALDEKRIGQLLTRNFKLKSLKKFMLTAELSAMILAGATVGVEGYKILHTPVESNASTVYEEADTTTLENAPDEVIICYLNESISEMKKYVYPKDDNGEIISSQNGDDLVQSVKDSYFFPAMSSYEDYRETQDEACHDRFIQYAKEQDKRVRQINEKLGFNKSIYRFAKYIDGEVCVPYPEVINNSTLPANGHIKDDIVYVPANTLSEEEAITLGND